MPCRLHRVKSHVFIKAGQLSWQEFESFTIHLPRPYYIAAASMKKPACLKVNGNCCYGYNKKQVKVLKGFYRLVIPEKPKGNNPNFLLALAYPLPHPGSALYFGVGGETSTTTRLKNATCQLTRKFLE